MVCRIALDEHALIAKAKGSDLRCFVVGRKVVVAMQRDASPGEFRANLHRGGSAVAATLSAEEKRIAVRAAGALGLGIAGVDLLRSNRGPLLLEVNASPGLEGIEAATGIDVAGAIIDLLRTQAGGSPAEVGSGTKNIVRRSSLTASQK